MILSLGGTRSSVSLVNHFLLWVVLKSGSPRLPSPRFEMTDSSSHSRSSLSGVASLHSWRDGRILGLPDSFLDVCKIDNWSHSRFLQTASGSDTNLFLNRPSLLSGSYYVRTHVSDLKLKCTLRSSGFSFRFVVLGGPVLLRLCFRTIPRSREE